MPTELTIDTDRCRFRASLTTVRSRITARFATATLIGALLAAPACTASPRGGSVESAKKEIASCDAPVNTYVAIDGTASGDLTTLEGPRRRAIEGKLAEVAACGGQAKVVVFSSSSAATTTLFEGGIELTGATDQARARRLGPAVVAVADQISAAFDAAVPTLESGGSDPVAQLRLFAEWAGQVDEGESRFVALTDGFQTAGIGVDEIVADPEAAASRFEVPDLSGAEVTFAGIGELATSAPPTEVVDALKAFYRSLCQRAGADICTVVTEVSGATS